MIIIGGFHKLIDWEKKYNTIIVNNYFIVKAYDISRSLLVNKKKRKKKTCDPNNVYHHANRQIASLTLSWH